MAEAFRFNWHKHQMDDIHAYLDKQHIPRNANDGNEDYALLYRIKLLEQKYLKSLSEIETYYMKNECSCRLAVKSPS
jgi:hypothetical protein